MNKTITIALVGNAPKEKHDILNQKLSEEDLTDVCDIVLYGADGQEEIEALQDAIEDCEEDEIQGIVCLPLSTSPLAAVQEIMGEDADNALSIYDNGCIKMASVKENASISEAAETLSTASITDAARKLLKALKRDYSILNPRIAILSFNPTIATNETSEETNIIAPAVEELAKEGLQAFGPYDSSTFFDNDNFKAFDAVLQMYDAQCMEKFRQAYNEDTISNISGTNLPIVSTYAEGIHRAIFTALDLFRYRKRYDKPFKRPLEKLYHERKEDGEKARFAIKKKGFNPAEHRRENITFITRPPKSDATKE